MTATTAQEEERKDTRGVEEKQQGKGEERGGLSTFRFLKVV